MTTGSSILDDGLSGELFRFLSSTTSVEALCALLLAGLMSEVVFKIRQGVVKSEAENGEAGGHEDVANRFTQCLAQFLILPSQRPAEQCTSTCIGRSSADEGATVQSVPTSDC